MKQLKNFPTRVQTTAQTSNSIYKWFVVDRTMTTATNVIALPANLVPIHICVQTMGAVSNAGTAATVVVGFKGGTGSELSGGSGADVKSNNAQLLPALINGLVVASPTSPTTWADKQITTTYIETGTASTAGGPWLVSIECMENPYH
jgi:hypothetical protein